MRLSKEMCGPAVLLLLLGAATAFGQSNKPAVEYQSLMNLPFYEADGGFLVERLQLVFPPPGVQKATFVIAQGGKPDSVAKPTRRPEVPVKARIWLKAEALMMMRKIIELIFTVSNSASFTARQVRRR